MEFRLTKLDAFSGAIVLRMLAKMPEEAGVLDLLTELSEGDLQSLMKVCLEHSEVLLPARLCIIHADYLPASLHLSESDLTDRPAFADREKKMILSTTVINLTVSAGFVILICEISFL